MDSTYFLRQLDIADPSQFRDKPVTVIGAGGIGAATVVALAKTGFENITVYDFDTVEEHNLPNQLLPIWVGNQDTLQWAKTTALFHLVHDLADISITPINERYTESLDGKAEELPCTARATMFNSFIIAGHLVALLVAFLNGWQYPWRFYYNVRSFQTLPVYQLQRAA